MLLAEELGMASVREWWRVGLDAVVARKHFALGMMRCRVRRLARASSQS